MTDQEKIKNLKESIRHFKNFISDAKSEIRCYEMDIKIWKQCLKKNEERIEEIRKKIQSKSN